MIGGGGTLMCTHSDVLTVYIDIHTGTYWHLCTNEHEHTSHFLGLITAHGFVCATVYVQPVPCNISFPAKRHIKALLKTQEASLNNLWSAFSQSVSVSCSIPTHRKNRRNSWRRTQDSRSYKWTTGKSFQSLHAVDFRSLTPQAIPVLDDLMIRITASTPPLFSSRTRTHHLLNHPHLDQSI